MHFLANIKFHIGKNNSPYVPYWVDQIKIADSWKNEYPLEEDVKLIETDHVEGIPKKIEEMSFDGYAVIECEFWGYFSQDYWGEYDAEFELRNVKFEIVNY